MSQRWDREALAMAAQQGFRRREFLQALEGEFTCKEEELETASLLPVPDQHWTKSVDVIRQVGLQFYSLRSTADPMQEQFRQERKDLLKARCELREGMGALDIKAENYDIVFTIIDGHLREVSRNSTLRKKQQSVKADFFDFELFLSCLMLGG